MKNTPNSNINLRILLCAFILHCLCLAALAQTNLVLALDGISGYVTVPSASDLQNPTQITVEAWIYPNPPPDGHNSFFIAKSDGQSVNSQRSFEFASLAESMGKFFRFWKLS
jgi:hypothetical protein